MKSDMRNAFRTLAGFFDLFEIEVEGRDLGEPPREVANKLRDFARGKLPQAKQAELVALLHENPHWVSRLADEVKALRPAGA
jgi:hypothetical protein